VGIIDEHGKRTFNKKLQNDPAVIVDTLRPFKNDITDIAVESTYNWYWLVDLLMAEGYKVHLANPGAIQKYTGLELHRVTRTS
jgi:transposase